MYTCPQIEQKLKHLNASVAMKKFTSENQLEESRLREVHRENYRYVRYQKTLAKTDTF